MIRVAATAAEAEEWNAALNDLDGYPRRGDPYGAGIAAQVPLTWDGVGVPPIGWSAYYGTGWDAGAPSAPQPVGLTADRIAQSKLDASRKASLLAMLAAPEWIPADDVGAKRG